MIKIEFDGGVITLREPNRAERITAMDIRDEILALDDGSDVSREMMERAETVLLGMVEGLTHGKTDIPNPRDEMERSGLFLTEGIAWLQAIVFRKAGELVGRNGDLGSGGSALRRGAEVEGVSTS